MMSMVPKRLKKEPLIEVIWQLQFEAPGAAEVLPGLLFTKLQAHHPDLLIERLPAAELPAVISKEVPNFRFAAKVRIKTPNSPLVWQVGDRVVTVNCAKPYVGWDSFYTTITSVIRTLEESHLIPNPLRHSLRYLDFISLDKGPDLSAIQLDLKIGAYQLNQTPIQVRVELPETTVTHIVQIVSPAEIMLGDEKQRGTLIDLETLSQKKLSSWAELRQDLEHLHDVSKTFFFTQLLTSSTIEKLEPEY